VAGRSGGVRRGGVIQLADLAGGAIDGDEARAAVGELEVPRPVDRRPGLGGAAVLEVVVADQADVRDRQRLDEREVVLVARAGAGAGEVAEVGEEERRGPQARRPAQQPAQNGVGAGVRPGAAVADDDEGERVADGRRADAPCHREISPTPHRLPW